ncbi:seminase-like [Haematobia irritans]|uniref:seminase-like n=1 Tax=Haematobia irritans TaxID=7368 RepID=UPI003F4F89EE
MSSVVSSIDDDLNRIIGGTKGFVANTPYMLYIKLDNKFICGASLYSEYLALTAAHCVFGVNPSRLAVVGGTNRLGGSGITRRVTKLAVPKSYSRRTMSNDVALLRLDRRMRGRNIRKIKLFSGRLRKGMRVRVSGWGLTSENGRSASRHLRSVVVPLTKRGKCQRLYKDVTRITKTMFCASKPGIKDSCSGDSGGPAVYKGKQVGIVSWGYGCAHRNYPGVYSKIATLKKFIRKAAKLLRR